MPPRSTPTARQERLGSELRKLRERARLTARAAANLLGVDQAQISNLEAGRIGASEDRIRRLASHYACDDVALVAALVAMATERERGWWEEYRSVLPQSFLDLAEAEFHAHAVGMVRITDVPGIMQTEAHARALFGYTLPELEPAELEARVAHRMQRRLVLDRCPPPTLEAVIHEAALRMLIGGTATAREQLAFLLELSERPAVEIRVIPFSSTSFAGTGCSMYYLKGPVPQLDTVQLDTPLKGVFLDAEAQLSRYRALFARIQSAALSPHESRDFISRVIQAL